MKLNKFSRRLVKAYMVWTRYSRQLMLYCLRKLNIPGRTELMPQTQERGFSESIAYDVDYARLKGAFAAFYLIPDSSSAGYVTWIE
jgi:hypothetical protein